VKGLSLKSYFRFLAFMLMMITYLPIVYQNLPSYIRSHYLWSALWILSIIIFRRKVFLDKTLQYVLAYLIVFFILLFANFWEPIEYITLAFGGNLMNELFAFSIAFSIIAYFKSYGDYEGLAIIVKWTIIFIGITAILSIYSSFIDPLYVRKLTSGKSIDAAIIYKLGGGGYGFASALVCLFPLLIYFYKNNTKSLFSKNQILLFGIICFFALLRIQIFANILVAFIFILLSLVGRRKFGSSIITAIIVIIIFLVIPQQFYADLFSHISTYFKQDSDIHYKFVDLSQFLIGNNGNEITEVSGRVHRYLELWEAFLKNPLLGYFFAENPTDINRGGHLYFMYKLTGWGIINFLFFTLIFIKFYKVNNKMYDEKYSYYFFLSFISIIALGLMKNLVSRDLWYIYFIILPGIYYLTILKNKKENRKLQSSNLY